MNDLNLRNAVPSFTAADWFQIAGYGCVASVLYHEDRDPKHLVGKQVLIDGGLYEVRRLERFSSEQRPLNIALLVRENSDS